MIKKFGAFDSAKAYSAMGSDYPVLPKGGYVCKVMGVILEEGNYGTQLHVQFDIAEGDYKNFYQDDFKRRKENSEDAKYTGNAWITVADDASEDWVVRRFKTFIEAIEDSNNGFHWDWDETKLKGLLFGGLFHIKQTQSSSNGNIYDNTRLASYCSVEAIREGKFKLPKDKLIDTTENTVANVDTSEFTTVPDSDLEELPFT